MKIYMHIYVYTGLLLIISAMGTQQVAVLSDARLDLFIYICILKKECSYAREKSIQRHTIKMSLTILLYSMPIHVPIFKIVRLVVGAMISNRSFRVEVSTQIWIFMEQLQFICALSWIATIGRIESLYPRGVWHISRNK